MRKASPIGEAFVSNKGYTLMRNWQKPLIFD